MSEKEWRGDFGDQTIVARRQLELSSMAQQECILGSALDAPFGRTYLSALAIEYPVAEHADHAGILEVQNLGAGLVYQQVSFKDETSAGMGNKIDRGQFGIVRDVPSIVSPIGGCLIPVAIQSQRGRHAGHRQDAQ